MNPIHILQYSNTRNLNGFVCWGFIIRVIFFVQDSMFCILMTMFESQYSTAVAFEIIVFESLYLKTSIQIPVFGY